MNILHGGASRADCYKEHTSMAAAPYTLLRDYRKWKEKFNSFEYTYLKELSFPN